MSSTNSTAAPVARPEKERVAVIGTGLAGVATAAALTDYGLDFIVYGKEAGPGGLWYDNYPGAKVQSGCEYYEFPAKRYPEAVRNRPEPALPVAAEVCTYAREFIEEKGMGSHFHYNTVVTKVTRESESKWIIELDSGDTEIFTYVIVCSGIFSEKPNKLDLQGQHEYIEAGGKILHTSEWKSLDDLRNKRVMIIGNAKSASDAAVNAARLARKHHQREPIQLVRRPNWYIPRYLGGLIHYRFPFYSSAGTALFPRYYEDRSIVSVLLHGVLSPIKWIMWRLLELLLYMHIRLPWHLMPSMGSIVSTALDHTANLLDENHIRAVRAGDIDMRLGTVAKVGPGRKVHFSDGKEEEVDVVLMATGFEMVFDFLDQETIRFKLDVEEDGMWLYRNVLPANLSGLAFVGSNTISFMGPFTFYIQAYWLVSLLAGRREWPDAAEAINTVQREKVFRRRWFRDGPLRGAYVVGMMNQYHALLYKEVGARMPFDSLGFLAPFVRFVSPILPSTMRGALEPQTPSS